MDVPWSLGCSWTRDGRFDSVLNAPETRIENFVRAYHAM
jgi:hypothetical protein